jgi:ABC-type phosphate transport system substrate-binding protein
MITSLALLTMVGAPGVVQAEVVLVGSSSIHFNEISKTKLRDLYTGQSQAVGDTAVLVIDRDDAFGERSRFISGTLGFTTEEFRTVQRLLECIGISKAPTVARDSQHMVDLLANNPNALGYLTRKELQGSAARSKFKFIKVLAE